MALTASRSGRYSVAERCSYVVTRAEPGPRMPRLGARIGPPARRGLGSAALREASKVVREPRPTKDEH
jgi:hypothetical protein